MKTLHTLLTIFIMAFASLYTDVSAATSFNSAIEQEYRDGRPAAVFRMDAKDHGIVLRYGDGPGKCDMLGARDVWVFEDSGTYYMHYDAAGPKGWLTSLAVSKDMLTWEKKGPVLDFGKPGEEDSAGACYGVTYKDGKQWHMYYLGTPNVTSPPNLIPGFPYLTMKAKANSPAGPWAKQKNVVPFRTKPNTYYSLTASPGHVIKNGGEYLQFFSSTTRKPGNPCVQRTVGIARTNDLDGAWTVDPNPMVPIEEQIENSTLYYEKSNKTWFLFTNHIGIDKGEYTDAIWVYWSKDLNKWDPKNKAVVLDGENCTWSTKCIGLPSVVQMGKRLALFYDAPGGSSVSHMKRHVGLAWLDLPVSVPKTDVSAAKRVKVADLRCEYLVNPLGIDEVKPRLSWKLESSQRGQKQSAYRLLVASSSEKLDKNIGDLWDSGKVQSDQSIYLAYSGKELKSRMRCFWKVMVWDKDSNASNWSEPAEWSMGLLEPNDWRAKWIGIGDKDEASGGGNPLKDSMWIWYPQGEPAKSSPAGDCYFRKTIQLDKNREINKATLVITADNSYKVWLNNAVVGSGSDFNNVQSYDIKDKLTRGQNVISIKAVNTGDSANPAGMIASLRIVYANGKIQIINSNQQWRCTRESQKDWERLSFDDSTWVKSKYSAKFGGGPWGKVGSKDKRRGPACYFRTEFKALKGISKATAYICGLGYNKLFINGGRIGNRQIDPILRDYSKQSPYSVYDVTGYIKNGSNAIGIALGNGRFSPLSLTVPTKTFEDGSTRVLLQLELTYVDGSSGSIISDDNWTATDQGPIRNHSDYDGETYDGRMEMPDWNKVGFSESSWQRAVIVAAPKGPLRSSSLMQPMRITGIIKPVKLTEPKAGVWVFDMGQNMVGWCRLKVKGSAGTTIKLHYSENIYADGMIDYRNLRSAKCTDYYICKGKGLESYRPSFTYHGFRYVEVTGLTQKPMLDMLLGEIVNTDMPFAGDFKCSDPTITQILKNARWGIRGNYLSIPTDCPQRDERQGWQGDRGAEQLGETYLFGNQLLYEKWMGDIRDSQRPDGNLSDVCPNYWAIYNTNVTWPACFVIVPGNIYRQNGDMRAIERNYPYMAKWIDHLRTFVKDGIIAKDNYGDWCVPPESKELIHSKQPWRTTPKEVMATTYYYYVLTRMAEYARLQGLDADVKKYQQEAELIKNAFNQKLYNKELGHYGNGSQTSQILPLRFGMVPKDCEKKIFDYFINHIETKTGGAIGTGLIGGQWLMRTLSDNGRIDIAHRFATRREYPSWGYMIDNGATTIWELWNGNTANPAMNSGNHVMLLGDLIIWMFEYLGGIQPDIAEPGFKHIIMNPQIAGNMTYAHAEHDSPYGKILSHWKIEKKSFTWNITIPTNTTATVHIPAGRIEDVTESGKSILNVSGVKFLRMEKIRAVFTVESGKYEFKSVVK